MAGETAVLEEAAGKATTDAAPSDNVSPDKPDGDGGLLNGKEKAPTIEAAPVYEFKLPDGAQADAETMDGFKALATELKLPAEKAQAVVDLGMKLLEKQTAAIQQQWSEQRAGWVGDLKADPDFGGKNFDQTVEGANRVLRQYGDKALVAEIRDLGLDSHPGLVRMLARVARATAEDKSIDRDVMAGGSGQKSIAERMYPKG